MAQLSDSPRAKRIKCPRCRTTMRVRPVAGTVIDTCEDCEGLWLDEGELDKIIAKGGGDIIRILSMRDELNTERRSWNDLDSNADAPCPRCDVPMNRYEADGIKGLVIDGCGKCKGVWYDGGEIDEHLEQIKSKGVVGYFKRLFGGR